jgi:hypothetical protein
MTHRGHSHHSKTDSWNRAIAHRPTNPHAPWTINSSARRTGTRLQSSRILNLRDWNPSKSVHNATSEQNSGRRRLLQLLFVQQSSCTLVRTGRNCQTRGYWLPGSQTRQNRCIMPLQNRTQAGEDSCNWAIARRPATPMHLEQLIRLLSEQAKNCEERG